MEERYFCVLCKRVHRPYVGLVYTEHISWGVPVETVNDELMKKGDQAFYSLFNEILQDLSKFREIVMRLPKLSALVVAKRFKDVNAIVHIFETHVEILFFKSKIIIHFESRKV